VAVKTHILLPSPIAVLLRRRRISGDLSGISRTIQTPRTSTLERINGWDTTPDLTTLTIISIALGNTGASTVASDRNTSGGFAAVAAIDLT
jgi:hypothetical protein